MATSGQVKTNTEYDSYFWVKWEQVGAQDIANNKTQVKWSCGLYTTHKFYRNAIKMSAFSINGTKVYNGGTYSNFTAGGEQAIASGTLWIDHNNDGTQSLVISAFTGWLYSNHSYSSGGDSWALNSILRASQPSCITYPQTTEHVGVLGSSFHIHMNSADGSFRHNIYYWRHDKWNLIAEDVQNNYLWTTPVDFANDVPNSMVYVGTIAVDTYSGSTFIGTKTVGFKADVPEYSPTGTISISGNNLYEEEYIEGKSSATVSISAESSYSATIKSISSEIEKKFYAGTPFTTPVLSKGAKSVRTVIVDSRGKSAIIWSDEFDVAEYSQPWLTSFSIERQEDGTTVIARLQGGVSPIKDKNTKSFTVTLNGVTQDVPSDGYTVDGTVTFTNVSTDTSYIATAKVADWYTSASKNAALPTVEVTMDFHRSGKGVAFGKVAEHEKMLDIAPDWQVRYKGYPIEDVIVEQGTNGIWTYRKWDSGIAECWGVRAVSDVTINQHWESVYYADPPEAIAYPFTFTDVPMETATMHCNNAWTWMGAATGNTASYTARYYLMRPFPAEVSFTIHIHYYVKGRWK